MGRSKSSSKVGWWQNCWDKKESSAGLITLIINVYGMMDNLLMFVNFSIASMQTLISRYRLVVSLYLSPASFILTSHSDDIIIQLVYLVKLRHDEIVLTCMISVNCLFVEVCLVLDNSNRTDLNTICQMRSDTLDEKSTNSAS